jgi:hypothetical protein
MAASRPLFTLDFPCPNDVHVGPSYAPLNYYFLTTLNSHHYKYMAVLSLNRIKLMGYLDSNKIALQWRAVRLKKSRMALENGNRSTLRLHRETQKITNVIDGRDLQLLPM